MMVNAILEQEVLVKDEIHAKFFVREALLVRQLR
jgi:hypothetical protein